MRSAALLAAALLLTQAGSAAANAQAAEPPANSVPAAGARTDGAGAQNGPQKEWPERFGFGHSPSAAEIAAWDIDVRPDGTGLPPGSGTVASGAAVYAAGCSVCHGATGIEGPYNILVGRQPGDAFPFAEDPTQPKTIGSYWPYATTLFDYIRRTMPPDTPGALTDDEVYGLTAYLLHLNEIVPEDIQMNRESLPRVVMPAVDRFRVHER